PRIAGNPPGASRRSERRRSPKRNVLKLPRLHGVVAPAATGTSRTHRPRTPPGMNIDLENLTLAALSETGLAVNKRGVLFNMVEDSLEQHPVPPLSEWLCRNSMLSETGGGMLPGPTRRIRTDRKGGRQCQDSSLHSI